MSLHESIVEDIAFDWFGDLDYALAHRPQPRQVNHARLRAVTTEHPFDLSKTLQHPTQAGLLESTGRRGAVYHLPGGTHPDPRRRFWPCDPNFGAQLPEFGCLLPEFGRKSRP
jgi:hypothetical protein